MLDCLLDENYGVPEIHRLDSNEIEHESEDLFQAEWSQEKYLPESPVVQESESPPPQLSGLEFWRKAQSHWSEPEKSVYVKKRSLKESYRPEIIAGLQLESPMPDRYESFSQPTISAIPGESETEPFPQPPDGDQRPHIYDPALQKFLLVDSGSQITAWPPEPGDKPIIGRHLRAVNGSRIKCFGTKKIDIKIGRKSYPFTAIKAEVDSPVIGWDFIRAHKLDLVWTEDGDNVIIDKKAKITHKLKFKEMPFTQSDRHKKLALIDTQVRVKGRVGREANQLVFEVASMEALGDDLAVEESEDINVLPDSNYKRILSGFPDLLKQSFNENVQRII